MRWNLFIMQNPEGGGEQGREAGWGGICVFAGSQDDRILQARAAEETNNPSFINSRLKRRQKKRNRKSSPNYITWSWCVLFLTVLTQLMCFSVNYPLPHPATPSTFTSPGYLGLIGNMRSYLHFKVLMQHFPLIFPSAWFSHLHVDK